MAAHRYWRLTGLLCPGLGDLELSEARLYAAGSLADAGATLTASVAPSAGAVGSLVDGLASGVVSWPLAAWASNGFFLKWDLGAAGAADINGLRLGSGSSRDTFPNALMLQWSDDGLAWTVAYDVQDVMYPGANALTTTPVAAVTSLVVESPTYWDPSVSSGASIFARGLFAATFLTSQSARSALAVTSGKWYWEHVITGAQLCGVCTDAATNAPGWDVNGWGLAGNGQKYTNGAASAYTTGFAANDVLGVILDLDGGTLSFSKNGANLGVAFSGLAGKTLRAAVGNNSGSNTSGFANFGQSLKYAPPAGFALGWGVRQGGNLLPLETWAPIKPRRVLGADRYPPSEPLTTDVGLRLNIRQEVAFDVYFGGPGRVYGTVKEKNTPANTPLHRRVLLLDEATRIVIRETWSDPVTGNFEFPYLRMGVPFTVLAYDYVHNYRAIVADNQLAEPM